jgi:thiosulfate/3-mercaptopyruvate sulfurtransferase
VVAYDDSGGAQAARLWYLLHVVGEPVAVLDGGLPAWTAAGGELSTEVPVPYPVRRSVREWPTTRFVDADGLARAIAAGTATVYDARTAERYAGGSPVDPRPGHVPGALNRPWQDNLGADGRFLLPEQLRAAYDTDRPVIAYCGSGVTACHDLLALAVAGVERTALYPGSWSQWGNDLSRPADAATATA